MPEGFFSPSDFTGAPIGSFPDIIPTPPFPVGILPFDFIGYGVGSPPTDVPPGPSGKGFRGAGGTRGKRLILQLASQVQYQTLLDQQTHNASQHAILKLTQKITKQHLEFERQLFRQKQTATWAAVLSEV